MPSDPDAFDYAKYEGHTPGPWHPGHVSDDGHPCDCRYILCDRLMGSIADVRVKNDEPNNDDPPLDEAKANSRLIADALIARLNATANKGE